LAAQHEQEEAEAAAQAARQLEDETAQLKEAEAQARKHAVDKFLADHKFKGINTAKKTFTKTTYPLHEAAKRNDIAMVKMLVEEGANVGQTNSRKQTAEQRALQEDKKGSHTDLIQFLKVFNASVGGA